MTDAGLTGTMHRMAGFRNVVVHGYQALDKAIRADIVAHRLGDLLACAAAIRAGLEKRIPRA